MYFRLSPQDMAAMQAGQVRTFGVRSKPTDGPVPSNVQRGVLQGFRDWDVVEDLLPQLRAALREE
jgi:hypothetical protein